MGSSPKGGLKCCHTETKIIMSFNGSTKAEESSNKRVNTEDVTMAVEDKEGTENKEILTTGPIPPSMGTPGTLSIRSSAENIIISGTSNATNKWSTLKEMRHEAIKIWID